MRVGRGAAVAAALAASVLASPAGAAQRVLHLGFADDPISFADDAGFRAAWLGRLAAVNADRLRINVRWRRVALRRPLPGEDPADPAWPGYDWARADIAVREAVAHGLEPVLQFSDAPSWAEGARRPTGAPAGTWRPDPGAVGTFARALATRYSGAYGGLPRVRYWQVWNEPNLTTYLTPQWAADRPASPEHYRAMLNAAYGSLKAVDPANAVITAGTAPFGDYGGRRRRLPPVRFVRGLLCLQGRALRPLRCPAPARFDVLAHHNYSIGGPYRRARNEDDVLLRDLHKLLRPLRSAERTGRALGARHHRLWITEVAWDSRPPDPDGVPSGQHARWLAEMLMVVARRGVDTVIWFHGRDEEPSPSYETTYQSGVFRLDGRPKPAARAFALPFLCPRLARGRVRLWGRAPGAAEVLVERRVAGGWTRIARVAPGARGRVFNRRAVVRPGSRLRARTGGLTSRTCSVR